MIRVATDNDVASILEIYAHYVQTSHCTFELAPPALEEMRIKIQESQYPWLVFEENSKVLGYAYATQWKAREAYKRTVETSVYMHQDEFGKGIAVKLYTHLIETLSSLGFHTILAGISLPNDASVRLHEKLGFHKVGELKEVGFKFDRWVDVGYWQLKLSSPFI